MFILASSHFYKKLTFQTRRAKNFDQIQRGLSECPLCFVKIIRVFHLDELFDEGGAHMITIGNWKDFTSEKTVGYEPLSKNKVLTTEEWSLPTNWS